MKTKYPMEAFALSMIIYTRTFHEAWLFGIVVLFITTLSLVIDDYILRNLPQWSRRLSITILSVSLTYSFYGVLLKELLGVTPTIQDMIIHLSLAALIALYILQVDEDLDYNVFLWESSVAYLAMLIIGLVREFLSLGQISGLAVADFAFMTSGVQKMAIGLLFAGIAIASLNRIFKYSDLKSYGFLILIPLLLVEQPFILGSINENLSFLLSTVTALLLFISIRMDLIFSRTSKEWKGLPIEMVSMSFIYLILINIM